MDSRVAQGWAGMQLFFSRFGYGAVSNDNEEEFEEHELGGQNQSQSRLFDGFEIDFGGDDAEVPSTPWIKRVQLCAVSGAVVLFINVVLVCLAAGFASKYPDNTGISSSEIVHEGSCGLVQRWDVALHFLINVLSTAVLGISNYCMQTLVAPSREEVDRCHVRNQWLDIGIPSVRNLSAINPFRRWSWFILLVTATPFHLMYNSAIFKSRSTREYSVLIFPSDMNLANISSLTTTNLINCFNPVVGLSWDNFTSDLADGKYERFDRTQCSEFLDRGYPSNTKSLIVFSDEYSVSSGGDRSILRSGRTGGQPDSFDTGPRFQSPDSISGSAFAVVNFTLSATGLNGSIYYNKFNYTFSETPCQDVFKYGSAACSDFENIFQLKALDQNLTVRRVHDYIKTNVASDVRINYQAVDCVPIHVWSSDLYQYSSQSAGPLNECLRLPAEERCRLHYSPPICIVVCFSGFVKVATMFLAVRLDCRHRSTSFLTTGDAVASFLKDPDRTTKGKCSMSKVDAQNIESFEAKRLDISRLRLFAASPLRWITTLILCLLCIFAGGFLLNMAAGGYQLSEVGNNIASYWRLGFGVANRSLSVSSMNGVPVLAAVLVANMPLFIVTIS
ncbi:hypothetical protein BJX99DRAFT_258376 [Aspergillus californicus]